MLHAWNVWLLVHTVFWHWQWTHRSKTSLGLPLHSDHGQQTTWRQLEDARSLCSSGRTLGPTGGEAPPGHGCPSSCLGLPRLPRRRGEGETVGLRGMRKLHTSRPWCRGHAYFISGAIVRAHKLKGSSTDISQCPRKQRGLCCQTQCFKGIIIRGEPQLIFFFFFLRPGCSPCPLCSWCCLKFCCWSPLLGAQGPHYHWDLSLWQHLQSPTHNPHKT